jgi:hypothetical protein
MGQMRLGICDTCYDSVKLGEPCAWCNGGRASDVETREMLPPGTMLAEKYVIGRLLGRGGFGATYLAWDVNLNVRVAIKEFLPRQLAGRTGGGVNIAPYRGEAEAFESGLRQFLEEARNLARFRDFAGIVSVLDFFRANATGYMVMEFLDGVTLDRYAPKALAPASAIRLLIPVADALRACHADNLIHRDVSPDNILLTQDGRVKLFDFGAARFAIGSRSTNMSVILKEGFAPFEQYQRNGTQGPWTDVYAFTATLYRLLTGELPPAAPDRVGGTAVPSLSDKHVAASAELQALIDRGMAIKASDRYQTVEALLLDLGALPELHGSFDPARAKRRRYGTIPSIPVGVRRPALAAAAMAGVLLAGTLTYAAVGGGGTAQPDANPARASAIAPQAGGSVESMREAVRQAAQSQLQLEAALLQARDARNSVNALEAIPEKTEKTKGLIRIQQEYEASAFNERDDALNKYIERIEWLAAHDREKVNTAINMEISSIRTPTIDNGNAKLKEKIGLSIDNISRHVDLQRKNDLKKQYIISSLIGNQ